MFGCIPLVHSLTLFITAGDEIVHRVDNGHLSYVTGHRNKQTGLG